MPATNLDSLTLTNATGLQMPGGAKVVYEQHNTIARTDTTAKNLFLLPATAVPLEFTITSAAVSDAGTTATLNIGKTGTNNYFVSAFDVKGATGSGTQRPTAQTNLMASVGASAMQVVGIYAETGGASTTGGPWTVTCRYSV